MVSSLECFFLIFIYLSKFVWNFPFIIGKTVSDKKDTIDTIVAHFNIQVDNPMCMLNQDTAKNFLNTKSIKEKYNVRISNVNWFELKACFCLKFFLKATQLQKMVEDLEENTVEIRNAKTLLNDHLKVGI